MALFLFIIILVAVSFTAGLMTTYHDIAKKGLFALNGKFYVVKEQNISRENKS